MKKLTFTLIIIVLFLQAAHAATDTLTYYKKNSGEIVDNRANADYLQLIM